ncbi:MAG: glycosyltransferase [Plectolyngbya sp. WJT66-NPBG17]|jgi:hypothetical protein|nr:glycosyltransferase [Plectolyngbya sp. WJT66-NPBG17]
MSLVVEDRLACAETETKQLARVCLLSARKTRDRVTDAAIYEIEDLIREFDHADLLTYERSPDLSRQVYTTAYQITRSRRLSNWITPGFNAVQELEHHYDLFFVVFRNIFELQALKSLKNWRSRCKKAICYIMESWNNDEWLQNRLYLLEPLKQFDVIYLVTNNSTNEIANYTQRPSVYLPFGVDTLRFCPFPSFPERGIDLASLGRRSSITHTALLNLSQSTDFFYYYDTAANLRTMKPQEHRIMYANLLKRSRYFIANYSCVDEPAKVKGNQEIGYRFFEGAAAGTVMIGCPPASELFRQSFDWDDAVIPMPFDAPEIGQVIADLDAQPERLDRIRLNNVVGSLQKHDWVYRWEKILATAGLSPTAEMQQREAYLHQLSDRMTHQANASECDH